ncbi:MAG: hypothetical protein AB7S38_01535 [Vulcanimicrobiota bacterium]
MGIFIEGVTKCALCEEQIDEEPIGFANIVANEREALYRFNERFFHQACLTRHVEGASILEVLRNWEEARPEPGQYLCDLCKRRIETPDDTLGLGLLTTERESPLYKFNYKMVHRSCLGRPAFRHVLEAFQGECEGRRFKNARLERILDGALADSKKASSS